MLKPVFDFGKQLLTLTRDAQQCKEDVKQLQQEINEVRQELKELRQEMNQTQLDFAQMSRVVERFIYEVQRTRDQAESERKIARLEMENMLLRHGRELPPSEENRRQQKPEGD